MLFGSRENDGTCVSDLCHDKYVRGCNKKCINFFFSNLYIAHYDNGNNAIDIDI
jgi:hypothetical protein